MSLHIESTGNGVMIAAGFNSPISQSAEDPSATSLAFYGPDNPNTLAMAAVSLTKITGLTGAYAHFAAFGGGAGQVPAVEGEYVAALTATVAGITQVATESFRISAVLAYLDEFVSTRATQADIINDSTPFPGGFIDAYTSSRATQAQIINDATPFAGGDIDAAITTRAAPGDDMGLTVLGIQNLWREATTTHVGTVGSFAEMLSDVLAAAGNGETDSAAILALVEDGGVIDQLLDDIKAITDIITDDGVGGPAYDRTLHSLAELRTALDAHELSMVTEVDVNEGKIDAVQNSVDALANSQRWFLDIPTRINKPPISDPPIVYDIFFRLFDALMVPKDADAATVNLDILLVAGGGSLITGPIVMTNTGVGEYKY